VHRLRGSFDLKKLGALYQPHPWIAILFLIPALSLAGVPPLSGFFAKLTLVMAGLETHHYLIVIVALIVSLLTLYSMTKIWAEVFWKPLSDKVSPARTEIPKNEPGFVFMILPIVFLAALTIGLGIYGEPIMNMAKQAGEQLMNPEIYIHSVLGEGL